MRHMRHILTEEFARAACDPDMIELAEWSIDDYKQLLDDVPEETVTLQI